MVELNIVLASEIVPALALPKAEKAKLTSCLIEKII